MQLTHATCKKAPALAARLLHDLQELGYTTEEATDMLNESGTREIAAFIKQELAFAGGYERKQELDTTTTACYVKTDSAGQVTNVKQITNAKDTTDMALVIKNAGTEQQTIETIDTGHGVQSARPLPEVAPTKVEPTPSAELMYDYNKLPVSLQRLVDDIKLHKVAITTALPVLHVVGWNQDELRPIYKLTSGQDVVNAYGYLLCTEARDWQNLPALVVAPTDPELLKLWNGFCGGHYLPAQADYKLVCCGSIRLLTTLDYTQFQVVVPAPAATKEQAAKVKRAAAKPAQEPTPAPDKKATPAITEATLGELATATNHMKKVSLVNQILVALGEPKVSSKCKKDELTPVIERLLAQFNVPVAPAPATTTKATTKAKAPKEQAAPAPTKAALLEWYVADQMRETGCTKKVAVAKFNALDYNWRSSTDRATAATRLGYQA